MRKRCIRDVHYPATVAAQGFLFAFYAPKAVRSSVLYKSCLSHNSETTEANLMKLRRKIKHNEKVFWA